MFICTNKRNYSILSIRFLWILEFLHPDVREVFDKHQIFSLSGNDGSGNAANAVVKMVYVCNI